MRNNDTLCLADCGHVFVYRNEKNPGPRVHDYGYHTGEINEKHMALAVAGSLAVNITNASPNDTFSIKLSVQE